MTRSWRGRDDELVLSFTVSNTGSSAVEVGGIGFPLPYNNNWEGKDQTSTWTENVVSDPAVSLNGGYVLTNRLTGEAPTLITIGDRDTPLEQYRFVSPGRSSYPAQFIEKTQIGFNFEGVYAWYAHSLAWVADDNAAAASLEATRGAEWNEPTSVEIAPGAEQTFSLRFFASTGTRTVNSRLQSKDRPTLVGIPGFVGAQNEEVKLIVHSSSSPSIESVAPDGAIGFGAPASVGNDLYEFSGKVSGSVFGRSRVTLKFDNGDRATAHYFHPKNKVQAFSDAGQLLFNDAWYTNESDYFQRAPSVITYDRKKRAKVLSDTRAWVAGLSDEGGTGAYLAATAKSFGIPSAEEVAKLEQFAIQTIWGGVQISEPGKTYGGVKKSLFYYDAALESQGVYEPNTPDLNRAWPKEEADKLERSYNYPHPTVLWWSLYRIARAHEGITQRDWGWFLDRAYDTIMGMKNVGSAYTQFGLMEGTYFLEVLKDFQREGATNGTIAQRASEIESYMKTRADIWTGERFPYASEFPWDNTGQEEVYAWLDYFDQAEKADQTIETLMAVMSAVPHWAYSGIGRSLWDFLYGGAYVPAAGGNTARIERILHHYKGGCSATPLLRQFIKKPTDISLLRHGYGGILGTLTLIDETGAVSAGFHSQEDYLNFDPLSGDTGTGFAVTGLATGAYVVNDAELGGWAGFGATVQTSGDQLTINPSDAYRRLVFLAPDAFLIEVDGAVIDEVIYNPVVKTVQVSFSRILATDQTIRLRFRKTADMSGAANFVLDGTYPVEAGSSIIPIGDGKATVNFQVSESKTE